MLARSTLDGRRRIPLPSDELAGLLIFYARDGYVGLRPLADITAWWDVYGTQLPQPALDELAAAYPELRRTWTATAAVLERLVGLPRRALVSSGPDRRGATAMRVANW